MNNKVLSYSAGNYIQYLMMNHNGKEYEQEYIYKIYMYNQNTAKQKKLTQHCKSTIYQ